MGQKTNKAIEALKAGAQRLQASLTAAGALVKQYHAHSDRLEAAAKDLEKETAAVKKSGNLQDPEYVVSQQLFRKAEQSTLAVWEDAVDSFRRCQAEQAALKKVLGDFSKYIAEKKRSKNPFKSQKSVPLAEETIKAYTMVIEGLSKMVANVDKSLGHPDL